MNDCHVTGHQSAASACRHSLSAHHSKSIKQHGTSQHNTVQHSKLMHVQQHATYSMRMLVYISTQPLAGTASIPLLRSGVSSISRFVL
jgi:hypothetical protein